MKKEFFIAGVQFRPSKGIIEGLKEGVILTLTPEPDNKFDPNAIKVVLHHYPIGSVHLGYVPAKLAAEIGAAMEIHGDSLQCTLTTYTPEAKTWERLGVTIELIKLEEDPNA